MQDPDRDERQQSSLMLQIFSVSAGLVGVCLTGIGLFRVLAGLTKLSTLGDDLLALDALLFLLSCFFSFAALRTRKARVRLWLERVTDAIFFLGLSLMVVVAALIVYAII